MIFLTHSLSHSGCMCFFVCEGYMIFLERLREFFVKRLHDFFVEWFHDFLLLRGCMIFFVERLRDFLL